MDKYYLVRGSFERGFTAIQFETRVKAKNEWMAAIGARHKVKRDLEPRKIEIDYVKLEEDGDE